MMCGARLSSIGLELLAKHFETIEDIEKCIISYKDQNDQTISSLINSHAEAFSKKFRGEHNND
jgi:hypothetical protein